MQRHKPLRPKPLDEAEVMTRARVRAMAFARDGGCLLRGARAKRSGCFGGLTPHHLRKQGQGGKWTIVNIVCLCAHHNDDVEDHPNSYHDLGLVVRRGENTEQAWSRLHDAGLVSWHWDGLPRTA